MIFLKNFFVIFFYLSMMMIIIDSSSNLFEQLKKHKTITLQSKLSSPIELIFNETSQFQLTCSFLSNFAIVDIFWLHNGSLIQSFISKKRLEEVENVDDPFLAVSIVSKLTIEKLHYDLNGFYQCIAVHQEIYAQRTFYVQINSNEINSTPINYSKDTSITVHTSQALFEPRKSISIMCRIGNNQKDQCQIQWFNQYDQSINLLSDQTDLILSNATFDDHMGLYTCQICCSNQCRNLTSFVYPAAQEDN